MKNQRFIYRVTFAVPPFGATGDTNTEFYFSSLSAIYVKFTEKHIGCKPTNLWNIGVSNGVAYTNRSKSCSIERVPVDSKTRQRSPEEGANQPE